MLAVCPLFRIVLLLATTLCCLGFSEPLSAQEAKAPSAKKLYELRFYTTHPGEFPDLHARFRDHTLGLFEKHGMENIIYWTVSQGTKDDGDDAENMLVYVIAHRDAAAKDASWKAFREDPEWKAVAAKSEENGKILAKPPRSILMTETEFSAVDEPVNRGSDSPARLWELRQYNDGPEKVPFTVDRFASGEQEIFTKHGMQTVKFWTATDNSAFIYLLAHKDKAAAEDSWKGFFTDFARSCSNIGNHILIFRLAVATETKFASSFPPTILHASRHLFRKIRGGGSAPADMQHSAPGQLLLDSSRVQSPSRRRSASSEINMGLSQKKFSMFSSYWRFVLAAVLTVIAWLPGWLFSQEQPLAVATMLPQAHAHNDYLHQRPLLDALDQGFASVEADIFLVEDQLLVAHTRSELSPERSLRSLYLDPLSELVNAHAGSVYGDGRLFTLLIDIKSEAEATYRSLDKLLAEYPHVFCRVENNEVHRAAVTAIVSGNRAFDAIAADSSRWVGIDGRLSDLDSDQPEHLLPLISDNWGLHFSWRGSGPMPIADLQKLSAIVNQAHQRQRRIRFWGIPDNVAAWEMLRDSGVHLINTDNLAGLHRFLNSEK